MFSSNQELCISGPLNKAALQYALTFCLTLSGYAPTSYQITENNVFALGWHDIATGWKTLLNSDLKLDTEALTIIILNYMKGLPANCFPTARGDGSFEKGFVIVGFSDNEPFYDDGFLHPEYGIVKIAPFTCEYAE